MESPQQKSIEYFFEKYGVTDPDKKAEFLPLVTDTIYDYNMLVVDFEKELDQYRKEQLIRDMEELEQTISSTFEQ
ncbi:MAG: hypothetical protein HOE80_04655 [Candidatus Magasanikbacteria bacterium]|jgi:hypothetical protein|nr:hypothetical protein [Candidatus Magasanikbacteria bacterium]MBT4071981.1 hypothetical protein [Candidatus Magasanikbacteria bacterium]